MILIARLGGAADNPVPWYDLQKLPGANFYDIEKAHEAQEDAQEADEARNLTRLLQKNSRFYEVGEEYQFRRWADFVEPRVAPSGDLRLLDLGYREMRRMAPLDGKTMPPMGGSWEPIGPFASGTSGAGRLNSIDFHPTDINAFMVGSAGGGLWFTADAGKTWSTPTDKIANLGAISAAYDPSNPNTIYLATGDGFSNIETISSIGLLKSTDGGKTWKTTGLTYDVSKGAQITKVAINPKAPEKIFVATGEGLQISTDGGATFKAAPPVFGKVWDVEFHPTNPSIVYVSTNFLFVSNDGGTTFIRSASVISEYRMLLAVSAAKPDYVYALRGHYGSTQGVSRSVDAGKTFTQTGTGSIIGCEQNYYDYAFDVNPLNAEELAAGCLQIFKSADGGANWARNDSTYHVDIQSLAYRKDGVLFAATDGGIWRNDGTGWKGLNNNLNIGQSYRVGVYPTDYDQVCTGRQDNGTDILAGTTAAFRNVIGSDGFECFWNSTGTRWYGEVFFGGFHTCDYANGQITAACLIAVPSEVGPWNTAWSRHPTDPAVVFAGRNKNMFRSGNNGMTWSQMGVLGDSGEIRNFMVAPSNTQIVYVLKGQGVHRTSDGGVTWQNVTGTISGTPTYAAVSASNPDEVWVTVSGYTAVNKVFHSVNGGKGWINETASGLPNLPANTVVVDDLGQNGVYVGMDVGVYFKRNGMTAWQNYSEGLPNAQIRELEIGRKGTGNGDRRLIAATYGRGILRTRLWDDIAVGVEKGRVPVIRDLFAVLIGTTLHIRFMSGTDRFEQGSSTLQLCRLDGTAMHRQKVPNFGFNEARFDMAGQGKGLFLLVLDNGSQRVSRRIMVDRN